MLNRIVLAIVFIMNTWACTYEVADNPQEDPMNLPLTTRHNLQQRSKTGKLTPTLNGFASSSKFSFQLPEFLDELGRPDPGNYTVQFSVEDPNLNTDVTSGYVLTRAEVIWKVSGNDVRRVIDVANGVSLSGTAEGLSVLVYDDSFEVIGTPKQYVVGLQVAKGTRPSIQQPPTYSTAESSLAGAGAFVNVPVPQNIGVVSVMVAVAPIVPGTAVGAYDVEILQYSGTPVVVAVRKRYDPRQTDWVPLAAGVNTIQINTSAACPAVSYQVTFGIDG